MPGRWRTPVNRMAQAGRPTVTQATEGRARLDCAMPDDAAGMATDLAQVLLDLQPAAEEEMSYWDGRLPLRITTYICEVSPPEELVTSIRTIVISDPGPRPWILVMRNPSGIHLWPGGRRKPGETHEQTLHREIREECGLAIDVVFRLGFVVCHHLGPRPEGYRYPYPDFVNEVYLSLITGFLQAGDVDEYELEATLVPIDELPMAEISPNQRVLLAAALSRLDRN